MTLDELEAKTDISPASMQRLDAQREGARFVPAFFWRTPAGTIFLLGVGSLSSFTGALLGGICIRQDDAENLATTAG